MRSKTIWVMCCLVLSATAQAETSCATLQTLPLLDLPDAPTQITRSAVTPSGDGLPEYCDVGGTVIPHVGFELRLPTKTWNGKLFFIGCGGSCGFYPISRANDALSRGYAVTTTNQGHVGRWSDASWAYNDLMAEINSSFRATHVTTVAAKAIVQKFYGQPPQYAYYKGCSNGGRQALKSVQTFPEDFDGVVAGSAPTTLDSLLNTLWGTRILKNKKRKNILGRGDFQLLHEAALKQCDGQDGLEDGLIEDPRMCGFDPAEIQCTGRSSDSCLTQEQVAVARSLYRGAVNSKGESVVIAGLPRGSELNWGVMLGQLEGERWNANVPWRLDALRFRVFFNDPPLDYDIVEEFDFDTDVQRMQMTFAISNTDDPDIRKFKASGGKILMYHGNHDMIPMENGTLYYEVVERVVGSRKETQDFFRLFNVPGMNHCRTGPGAAVIDYLSYLEDWVENGQAPEKMIGGHIADYQDIYGRYPDSTLAEQRLYEDPDLWRKKMVFSRPVFPYPLVARYSGQGDVNDAENFVPFDPTQKR
jgi:hypothetical protein